VGLLSILLLAPVASFAATKSIAGTTCKKAGLTQTQSSKRYTCVLVKKKLIWQIKTASTTPPPTQPVGPTWEQIAAEKAAAEAVAAQQAKEKKEAEAKAAAEAKIKEEAAAKAAKAEAEKPKVTGLVIGDLLWGDDFKGDLNSTIDQKKWTARNCHRTPSGMGGGACFGTEVVYYAPSAIKLDGSDDGAAVISTTRISEPLPSDAGICRADIACAFVSGRFDTHGKVAFQYGFIEARIKMPAGSGNHPAFWMLGDNINEVEWPTTGEMDITEIHGDKPFVNTSATHFSTKFLPKTCCWNHDYRWAELNVGEDLSAGFHTYAVAWLPDSISYYVDNRLVLTHTPQNIPGNWSFNDKFFLILNNAVNSAFGGSWANLQSSTMTIDWVRSYQLNGQGEVFTN
jgi:hypothetical protein